MTVDTDAALRGKKVLVTGADGFIGSQLTERLVDAGADVRALAYYNSFGTAGWLERMPAEKRAKLDLRLGDIRDPFFVDRLVEGCQIVLNLAALIAIPYSYAAPQSYVDVNVNGIVNLLEACRRHQPERIVHTSTSEVYGTALYTPIDEKHPLQGQSPYSASKIGADHMLESYVRSFELPAVILRPFNTFGPRQSERAVIPTIIRQVLDPAISEIRLGRLDPVRDFNFVDDVTRAFAIAGTSDRLEMGRAYNAGTGTAVTIADVVDRVRAVTGSEKPVVEEQKRNRPPASEVFTLLADSTRFRELTGWAPEITLDQGLSRTIDWWRAEIASGRVRVDQGYAT